MEWLWVAQVTVNFLFLIGMVFWWTERRSQRSRNLEQRMHAALSHMENRALGMETKAHEVQRRMEESFSLIASVGYQARELLQKGREEMERRIPSLEEQDLLSLSSPSTSEERASLPAAIEDAPLGLKAVLREQLF